MSRIISKLFPLFVTGILLCLASSAAFSLANTDLSAAWLAFDRGEFEKSVALAESIEKSKRGARSDVFRLEALRLAAYSKAELRQTEEARADILTAVSLFPTGAFDASDIAETYLAASAVYRIGGDHSAALEYANKALAARPESRLVEGVYCLRVGQVFVAGGFDVSGIIWLEKAEKLLAAEASATREFSNVYRLLSFSWGAKANLAAAVRYSEKLVGLTKGTRYRFVYLNALYKYGGYLSAAGRKIKAYESFSEGLKLSISVNDKSSAREFLTTFSLNLLFDNQAEKVGSYLSELKRLDDDGIYDFEIRLITAISSASKGDEGTGMSLLKELELSNPPSDFIIPSWRLILANRAGDWENVINFANELRLLAEKNYYRDELPRISFALAKAHFRLGRIEKARSNLAESMALVEEMRRTSPNEISISIFETYHEAFRLKVEMEGGEASKSFESLDQLKARLLFDKINDSVARADSGLSAESRRYFQEVSSRFIKDQNSKPELARAEREVSLQIGRTDVQDRVIGDLSTINALADSTVISYFFGLDGRLSAFVWEKESGVRRVEIDANESELKALAVKTRQDIKNRVYFKRDGKALFDKLLWPLGATKKHLVIVPDKFLWTIPFQALSSDGEKYLIEENLVTYAPSVAILAEQLRSARPERRSLRAFANATFGSQALRYVNEEAAAVSKIFGGESIIGATREKFAAFAGDADILHFSMHAEVDPENPLESFLGFRPARESNGKFTVENLLGLKLKKGSLVFLASCDTNTVLSGEGLVSLSWGMMAASATTVISAAWEANDKSSMEFTKAFYQAYKKTQNPARAHQSAAQHLIRQKSLKMHEPYYWAEFSLSGDFR